jgi:endonuclease III-like uncharacterized protein
MLAFLLSNKKLIGQATAVVALLAALYQLHDYVYDSGYKAAVSQLQAEQNARYEVLRKKYETDMQEAINTLAKEHAIALSRVKAKEVIITKTNVVKEYVTKEIEVPGTCDDLAFDVIKLLHDSTDIINSTGTYKESASTFSF